MNRLKSYSSKKAAARTRSFLYSLFRLALLIAIGYLVIYPVIYMISSSVKTPAGYLDRSVIYIPKEITFKYYKTAAQTIDYWNAFKSTLLYECVSAAIEILMCSFIAYGMARFKARGKGVFNALLILLILIPSQMIVVPMMMNYSKLDILGIFGLLNKLTGVDLRVNILGTPMTFYLPSLFGVGLRSGVLIYIYIQFFKGLPAELEEAAWMDGAGPIRTFIRIALPSSGVVILTVTVFSLIWHWNDYFLSSMYLTDGYPLAVWLTMMPKQLPTMGYSLVPSHPETMAVLMAGCLVFILPMLIIYIFVQRWFIESIDRVGITG